MTEASEQAEKIPCIRGCVWDPTMPNEEPRPKEAKHGGLCNSCYWRMWHALDTIPGLMANMRLKMIPSGVANYESERVSTKGDGSPAPFRVDALDKFDALFSKLVLWIDALAPELHSPPPSIRVWMGYSEVQGSRPVSPAAAHHQAAQLTQWFFARLETIAASSSAVAFHDDICFGWEDSLGVYPLASQYGTKPRPPKQKPECPICGKREVIVKLPEKPGDDVEVLCDRCKWVAEPEKYGHYARMFTVTG